MTLEKLVMLLNVCYSVLTLLNPPSLPHLWALSPRRRIVKLLTNAYTLNLDQMILFFKRTYHFFHIPEQLYKQHC